MKFKRGQLLYTDDGSWWDFVIDKYKAYSLHHYKNSLIVSYSIPGSIGIDPYMGSRSTTVRTANNKDKRKLITLIFEAELEIAI